MILCDNVEAPRRTQGHRCDCVRHDVHGALQARFRQEDSLKEGQTRRRDVGLRVHGVRGVPECAQLVVTQQVGVRLPSITRIVRGPSRHVPAWSLIVKRWCRLTARTLAFQAGERGFESRHHHASYHAIVANLADAQA